MGQEPATLMSISDLQELAGERRALENVGRQQVWTWFHQEKGEHRVRGGGTRYLLRWVVEQKVGGAVEREDDLIVQNLLLL